MLTNLSVRQAQRLRPVERSRRAGYAFMVLAGLLCFVAAASAEDSGHQQEVEFDIPQQRADMSLTLFAEQANLTLIVPFELARNVTTNRLQGSYSVADGIEILLAGTVLKPEFSDQGLLTNVTDKSSIPGGEPMVAKRRSLLAGIAAILAGGTAPAVVIASSVVAQTGSGEADVQARQLEEVVVSARRQSETSQDTPITMVALGEGALKNANLAVPTDLQNFVPGLTINGAFAASNPQIFIRGSGNSDFGDSAGAGVGVYVDDVFLQAPAGKMLQIFDIDTVEVLKGPQGTLFGRNNNGGSIQFRSVLPDRETEGFINLSYGRFDQYDARAAVSLPLGELGDGFLSTRLAVNSRQGAGYGEQRDENDREIRDIGRVNERAIRWITRWQSDSADIKLNINYSDANNDRQPFKHLGTNPDGTDVTGWRDPDDDPFVNYNDTEETKDVSTLGAFLNADVDIGSVTLSSVSAYYEAERLAALETDHTPNPLLDLTRNPVSEQFSQELRLSNNDGVRFNWTAGLFYFIEDLEVENLLFVSVDPDVTGTDRNRQVQRYTQENESCAVFAEGIYDITDQLSLTAGIRYTEDKKDFANVSLGVLANVISDFDFNDDAVTGRLILDYKFSDDALVYGSASRGFQGGGVDTGFASENNRYLPEFVNTYEVGLKSEWMDRKLRFNAALFYSDYEDIQVFTLLAGGDFTPGDVALGSVYTNAGTAEAYGADFEIQAIVSDRLSFNVGLALLDTQYNDLVFGLRGVVVDGSGNPFINAPEVDFNLGVDYSYPLSGGELRFNANYNYRSEVALTAANEAMLRGDTRGLFNGRVSYSPFNADWEIAAFGTNLSDEVFQTYVADIRTLGHIERTFGQPSRWGLQFIYNF